MGFLVEAVLGGLAKFLRGWLGDLRRENAFRDQGRADSLVAYVQIREKWDAIERDGSDLDGALERLRGLSAAGGDRLP